MVMNGKPFPNRYIPIIFEGYCQEFTINKRNFKAHFCDTVNGDEFDRLCPICYHGANIIFLCFALNNLESFQSLTKKHIHHIKLYAPKATVFLIGTKFDLYQHDPNCISDEDAMQLVIDQKFDCYLQCSAKDDIKVGNLFCEIARSALQNHKKEKETKCQLQ